MNQKANGGVDGVFANGNFLDPKVESDLHQSRLANFQREWPLIPVPVRLRLRELTRFPTRDNHNSCSGFIAGYIACKPGAFSDSYAQALAFALYSKDSWAVDEVQHADIYK